MPHTRQSVRKLLSFIDKNNKDLSPLLIITHDYPDPDAMASAYALQYLCEKRFGISSRIVYGGIIGRTENKTMARLLKIPLHKLRSVDFKRFKKTALVDTQPGFKNNSFPSNRKANIVIDQHQADRRPATDFALIDTECGATSALLAQALIDTKLEIPVRLATALVYGILSDTLSFFRASRSDIIKTYLNILPRCDMKALAKIQNPVRTKDFFLILSRGVQVAQMYGGLIVAHLGDITDPDSIPQVADLLLTYKKSVWSLATGRFKGTLRVSLRSIKKNPPASDVLKDVFVNRGEAGGHETIAGGSFKVGMKAPQEMWTEAEDNLAERLIKRLRLPRGREFHRPFI